MNEINLGDMMAVAGAILGLEAVAFIMYVLSKRYLTSDRFKRFLGVFAICVSCSFFPIGPLGAIFGFPSVLLASILVTLFLDRKSK